MSTVGWLPAGVLSLLVLAIGNFPDEPEAVEKKFSGRELLEITIEASVEKVWDAFTTDEGVRMWIAPLADIDFRIGGKIRANYNPEGTLGDPHTIENTIICYDPMRLFCFRCTKSPEGFPFAEAIQATWTVAYFEPVASGGTRLTLVGIGYTEEEDSKQMREFFRLGNKQVLEGLKRELEK